MNQNFIIDDLKYIYEEIKDYQTNINPNKNASYRKINLEFVTDFLNGIKPDKYFFSGKENEHSPNKKRLYYNENAKFNLSYSSITNNGGQVIHLDNTKFEIISKHKRMELNLEKAYGQSIDNIVITEITPEGLYHFYIRSYEINNQMNYNYCTYFIPAEHGKSPELLQTNLAQQKWGWFVPETQIRGTLEINDEDLPKLANKIYRQGLPKVYEALNKGKTLEITEEDRKLYQLNEEDKNKIKQIQKPQIYEEESLYKDKLNSEKFINFKKNKETRNKRQQEIRQQAREHNERIFEWNNSEENPTNIRKAQREEQLNKLKRQLEALESFKQTAPELITEEQLELLEKGYIYLEMINKANNEVHEIDTGMSEEMRTWYQEHYSNEGNKRRK